MLKHLKLSHTIMCSLGHNTLKNIVMTIFFIAIFILSIFYVNSLLVNQGSILCSLVQGFQSTMRIHKSVTKQRWDHLVGINKSHFNIFHKTPQQ